MTDDQESWEGTPGKIVKMESQIIKEGNKDMEKEWETMKRWQNQLIIGPWEVKDLFIWCLECKLERWIIIVRE